MTKILTTSVAMALASCVACFAASSQVASSVDSGGQRTTSAAYVLDGSVGVIGGNPSEPNYTAKNGYIGQLSEIDSLSVTGMPSSINQGSTSQLSGTAALDDTTVTALAGSDLAWGAVTYPFQSINGSGLLTAVANVYAAPAGIVNGSFLGVTGNTSVQVLGPYANAGIPDSWFLQYFGSPPNANAAPTADVTGTGQNNLFKYVAGLDPTNPASIFILKVASVTGQPTQKNLIFNPEVSGRTYTPQFRTNLVSGSWASLPGVGGPTTNINQVTVTDLTAVEPQKFYRIDISLP